MIPSPGYKFVHDSCSGDIKWILFQDDDTIIAEEKFQKLLMSSTNMTTCLAKKYSKAEVIRADSRGRSQYEREHYSVSRDEYPLDAYPTYCGGPCALLSRFDLDKIYEVAKLTNPGNFTMEDIIFTGIMRVKGNLTEPDDVRGICEHYNSNNKNTEIRSDVLKFCRSKLISENDCFMDPNK